MSVLGWSSEWTAFDQAYDATEPDPWDGPPPGTPARPGQRRPEDDPAPYCPDSHKHAGGRCWAPGCPNSSEPL